MKDAAAKSIYLKDYRQPDYWIRETNLHFDLHEDYCDVSASLRIERREGVSADAPLVLDGQELELLSLAIDGEAVDSSGDSLNEEQLTLANVPAQFELSSLCRIYPQNNTALEGLYKSSRMFCTQCEAEGFRKITYYLDRPDVLSVFRVSITADKQAYPVLLSNGNETARAEEGDGRHRVEWFDPFPKPAYLFALVAGDLAAVSDSFTTMSGKAVDLHIWVESKDLDKCAHAMDSLKRSMRWDEEVYGREYDLSVFNIVAVDDFNMGAMENKSLNIFNSSCVLARPDTATDQEFQRIEAIVAHEYFHNWSGNRVTCRDWFQLSLKEGFTVFRDASFSADMGSPTVKRVEDVRLLRTAQFAEDAGPMAHPIRPDSYMEISNFYTLTVYEKGAEVVGMLHTLLGPELFRQGSDLYFERHDGSAATCEDFVAAMEAVSGRDLGQFRRWYSQAGTPVLSFKGEYDADTRRYTLSVQQSCPPSPGQAEKQPYHIPLAMGLLGEAGALRLQLEGEIVASESADNTQRVLEITEAEQSFVFVDVPEQPVPSLLRGFSAPVRSSFPYQRDELLRLMQMDEDGFVRWDACQQLATAVLQELMVDADAPIDARLTEAFKGLLADELLDSAMVALMLVLPTEAYLAEITEAADPIKIHTARERLRQHLATQLRADFEAAYQRCAASAGESYAASAEQIARRSLANACLGYLTIRSPELAAQQFASADNMTDSMAALRALAHEQAGSEAAVQALDSFYQRWQHESLVLNSWLQVQAMSPSDSCLDQVKALMAHPAFDARNPNKLRSLIGGFAANASQFHREDGEGYAFLAEQIISLDEQNPQIASRLLAPLSKWRSYSEPVGQRMRAALERIAAKPSLSKDVYEVVSKSLL